MKHLLFVSLLVISVSIFSQTPDVLAKSFLEDIKSRGFENALKYTKKDSLMSIQSKIDKLNQQFKNQQVKLGEYYGYEEIKIDDNKIECIDVKVFILKFKNSPAQLNLVYYKPNNQWYLHNVIIKKYNNKRPRR